MGRKIEPFISQRRPRSLWRRCCPRGRVPPPRRHRRRRRRAGGPSPATPGGGHPPRALAKWPSRGAAPRAWSLASSVAAGPPLTAGRRRGAAAAPARTGDAVAAGTSGVTTRTAGGGRPRCHTRRRTAAPVGGERVGRPRRCPVRHSPARRRGRSAPRGRARRRGRTETDPCTPRAVCATLRSTPAFAPQVPQSRLTRPLATERTTTGGCLPPHTGAEPAAALPLVLRCRSLGSPLRTTR